MMSITRELLKQEIDHIQIGNPVEQKFPNRLDNGSGIGSNRIVQERLIGFSCFYHIDKQAASAWNTGR